MKRFLVAGIGNIFFGDDAFGCEVAAELAKRPLPEGVNVRDFGIRSYDLAYAMMEDYELIIFIDALSRGEAPGTLYLIEPEMNKNMLDEAETEVVNAHSMSPVRVLQLVRSLGGQPKKLYIVGCEPGVLENEDGRMGLSERVAAAVKPAANMIQKLIGDLSQTEGVEAGPKKVKPDQVSNRNEIGGSMDDKNVALEAWEILGALITLIIISAIIAMIPEMRRYLRLKNM